MSNDIYDFLSDFENQYSAEHPQEASKAPAADTSYPMTRAEAEAMGYKPLLDTAPEIQPCEYGYPCNDCGYCH